MAVGRFPLPWQSNKELLIIWDGEILENNGALTFHPDIDLIFGFTPESGETDASA